MGAGIRVGSPGVPIRELVKGGMRVIGVLFYSAISVQGRDESLKRFRNGECQRPVALVFHGSLS